jgi:integrase
MGRPNKVWYRVDRDAWVAKIAGKQVTLAKGKGEKKAATKALHAILGDPKAKMPTMPICAVADWFLEYTERERSELTLIGYKSYLLKWVDHVGQDTPAESIRPYHVTRWIETKKWGNTSRKNAIVACKRLMSWAKKQGYVAENHLAEMESPKADTREEIINSEDVARCVQEITRGEFRDFVVFLFETGARPSEAMRLEASHFGAENGIVVMDGKSTWKTKKKRIIYLTETAAEIVARRSKLYPEGPIFRNSEGRPWLRKTLSSRWSVLRRKLGLGKGATSASLRHLFVTEALVNRVPIAHVSTLVGHVDTTMVSRVYSKLHQHGEELAGALKEIRPASRTATASRRDEGSTVAPGPAEASEPRPKESSRKSPRKSGGSR